MSPEREGSYAGAPLFDVAISGAGPVGATLAVALARGGASVALVESAAPAHGERGTFDARPIALSVGSRRILSALGAWAGLAGSACPIRHIHVSDRGRFGFARMAATDYGLDALGHVVEASELAPVLDAALDGPGGVQVMRPARVAAAGVGAGSAWLDIAGEGGSGVVPRRVRARLLVAADGGRSVLRRALRIGADEKSYGQVAVVATVRPGRAHRETAYERFTADGPLALLPMSQGRCGLVWATGPAEAERLGALPDAAFLRALDATFGGRLGEFSGAGPRATHPLVLVRARDVVGDRVAVTGSAAHQLHPVAGQALNLGLRDAAALADVVLDAIRAGQDPGDSATLDRYRRWRNRDQRAVAGVTDAVVGMFSRRSWPVALVRDAGLLALDLASPLKRGFVMRATGLAGRQSRLARGLAP